LQPCNLASLLKRKINNVMNDERRTIHDNEIVGLARRITSHSSTQVSHNYVYPPATITLKHISKYHHFIFAEGRIHSSLLFPREGDPPKVELRKKNGSQETLPFQKYFI
jgi:hypothetical protein